MTHLQKNSSVNTFAPPAISAAIICLNEERFIGKCLAQLNWCDEIIVVDSGSTDRTIEIVRTFPNARLIHRDFDTFKQQKNSALDECRNDWVLSLDADEFLTESLRLEILSLKFNVAGYKLPRKNFIGDRQIRYGNWNPDFVLRLFSRSQCRWGGTNPHESVVTEGVTKNLKSELLHYSYASRDEYVSRNRAYAMMMVDFLRENGASSTRSQAWIHAIGNLLKAYVLRRGFLDGSDGLFLAWHGAKASYLKHSELAKQRNCPPQPL